MKNITLPQKQQNFFVLTIDYNINFSAMVEKSGCFLEKYINESCFPIVGKGMKKVKIFLKDFWEINNLLELKGKQKYCFAQIEHAFFLAISQPEIHLQHSIVFPGSFFVNSVGKFSCPLLTSIQGGKNLVSCRMDNNPGQFNKIAVLEPA